MGAVAEKVRTFLASTTAYARECGELARSLMALMDQSWVDQVGTARRCDERLSLTDRCRS
jgi:hypothetical protein